MDARATDHFGLGKFWSAPSMGMLWRSKYAITAVAFRCEAIALATGVLPALRWIETIMRASKE